jgi:hypothetical protein
MKSLFIVAEEKVKKKNKMINVRQSCEKVLNVSQTWKKKEYEIKTCIFHFCLQKQ